MKIRNSLLWGTCLFALSLSCFASSDGEIFRQRREHLISKLEGGIAILKNTPVYVRNNDVDYVYRTDSDFYYLTGCDIPDAVMILTAGSETPFVLFIDPPSRMAALWGSRHYTPAQAQDTFEADTVYALENLQDKFSELTGPRKTVYYDLKNAEINDLMREASKSRWGSKPDTFRDLLPFVHQMRMIKSPHEIDQMRHAIEATCAGLNESMRAVRPGMYEYEIQAILEYQFRINDCPFNGFPSIVASGPNATILHYEQNDRLMQSGELLLMDVGAEYNYYGADITRTFPVNGTFTKEQAEIYQLVLDAQEAAIDSMIPGVPAYHCHNASENVIKQGLLRLGLITDAESRWQYLLYYFPYINHSLGMDVHDVGDFGRTRSGGVPLEPGMVMTNEPALYFGENWIATFRRGAPRRYQVEPDSVDAFLQEVMPVYKKYMDIGIRIEDDILITPDGNEVLSKNTPKKIGEIEAIMREESIFNR